MSTQPIPPNVASPPDLDFDRDHLWHPYTSLTNPLPTYHVSSAGGVYLELSDGKRLIDGMSSWWSAVHGYNVPELNAAAAAQLGRMSHVMFGGLTHGPAIELGKRLVAITPEPLQKVFLADSGSVSVEVAMKMAVQYQYARGERGRTRFLTFRGGYHGDTTGPMSVCDPETGMHGLFGGFLPQHVFADKPRSEFTRAAADDLHQLFADHAHACAAFICEPLVQGAGGMNFYDPRYLGAVRQLCDDHGLLLIFDEIATGFGRTGELFVSGGLGPVPDILCLGKALTGGYLTLAATLCTDRVADVIGASDVPNLMHGPTFMGNPLACSIAAASIDLLLSTGWRARVRNIASRLSLHLRSAAQLPGVKDVRTLGAIGVVELHRPVDTVVAQAFFVARGVWVRPFGRLVYVMPPFIISDDELATVCLTIVEFCHTLSR